MYGQSHPDTYPQVRYSAILHWLVFLSEKEAGKHDKLVTELSTELRCLWIFMNIAPDSRDGKTYDRR